jgi:hypothetical protein
MSSTPIFGKANVKAFCELCEELGVPFPSAVTVGAGEPDRNDFAFLVEHLEKVFGELPDERALAHFFTVLLTGGVVSRSSLEPVFERLASQTDKLPITHSLELLHAIFASNSLCLDNFTPLIETVAKHKPWTPRTLKLLCMLESAVGKPGLIVCNKDIDDCLSHWLTRTDALALSLGIDQVLFLAEVAARFGYSTALPDLRKPINCTLSSGNRASRIPGKSIFIGFFGQTRMPDKTLPRLATSIAAQSELWRAEGFQVETGYSSWVETGNRCTELSDSIAFLLPLLPSEFSSYCSDYGINTAGQFQSHFPHIFSRITDTTSVRQSLDSQDVCNALEIPTDKVSLESESLYEASGVAKAYGARFCGSRPMLNQGKMWNCISRLREITRHKGTNAASPDPDIYLLFRTDLDVSDCSYLTNIAFRLYTDQGVFLSDHDPIASHINGLGDRFMMFNRSAAAAVFEMQTAAFNVMHDDEKFALYGHSLGCHRFLQSQLFASGIHIMQTNRISYQLCRPTFSIHDLRLSIYADLHHTELATVRDFLQILVTKFQLNPLLTPEEEYSLIAASNFFDTDWYLSSYPDVAKAKMDPIQHYIEWGSKEGRLPSAAFPADLSCSTATLLGVSELAWHVVCSKGP